MEQKQLHYNGHTLAYRQKGRGTVVMLLHGFGETGAIWKGQFDLFADCCLVVPDLPGSGGSDAVPDMSLEGLADVVHALWQEVTGQNPLPFILIGHSMGGYITMAFAEKYPRLLRAFGLFHSSAYADSAEKKEARQKGIAFIETHGATEFLKTTLPTLYAVQKDEPQAGWIKTHLAEAHNFSAQNLVSYYKAMMQRPDRTPVLVQTSVPVLFVMGQHDKATPLADGLRQCHLPSIAYIHILEQSGHMGMIEEKDRVNQLLLQFVLTIEKTA